MSDLSDFNNSANAHSVKSLYSLICDFFENLHTIKPVGSPTFMQTVEALDRCWAEFRRRLATDLGYSATDQETAEYLDITTKEWHDLQSNMDRFTQASEQDDPSIHLFPVAQHDTDDFKRLLRDLSTELHTIRFERQKFFDKELRYHITRYKDPCDEFDSGSGLSFYDQFCYLISSYEKMAVAIKSNMAPEQQEQVDETILHSYHDTEEGFFKDYHDHRQYFIEFHQLLSNILKKEYDLSGLIEIITTFPLPLANDSSAKDALDTTLENIEFVSIETMKQVIEGRTRFSPMTMDVFFDNINTIIESDAQNIDVIASSISYIAERYNPSSYEIPDILNQQKPFYCACINYHNAYTAYNGDQIQALFVDLPITVYQQGKNFEANSKPHQAVHDMLGISRKEWNIFRNQMEALIKQRQNCPLSTTDSSEKPTLTTAVTNNNPTSSRSSKQSPSHLTPVK
jgi:hypothetical protein